VLTRLVILWLLAEQPLHGYRIKKILDDASLRFWFRVEYGSIYSVLRTLADRGFVEAIAVEREGQRPERTRYAITRTGREHLQELLRRAWTELPTPAEALHVALAARSELPEEEIPDLIARRVSALSERLDELTSAARSAPADEIVDRQRALTQAELVWAQALAHATAAGQGEEE
jgi:DNA-binding PadR family transcriptional regulator